jgi:hypothetical protein
VAVAQVFFTTTKTISLVDCLVKVNLVAQAAAALPIVLEVVLDRLVVQAERVQLAKGQMAEVQ